MSEKRVDPEDGAAYTRAEMGTYYAGTYSKADVSWYWESCKVAKGKGKGRGKAAPEAKAKAKAKVKAKAKAKSETKSKLKLELWTNAVCPFAHRAVFAAALLGIEPEIKYAPLSGQVTASEKIGIQNVAVNGPFKSMTIEEIKALKEDYKKTINAGGEVPTIKTGKGDIILESEICAEFLDRFSKKASLVPGNPVLAAKVRLAMKKFNDVVGPCYGLLTNQDPSTDAEKAATLKAKLEKFAEVLDAEKDFCVSDKPTLVDVHCGPFLYRFSILLPHYRSYDLFQDLPEKLKKLKDNIVALPAFQKLTPITDAELVSAYAAYANGFKWADSPTAEKPFGGRGKSEFGK